MNIFATKMSKQSISLEVSDAVHLRSPDMGTRRYVIGLDFHPVATIIGWWRTVIAGIKGPHHTYDPRSVPQPIVK